MREEKPPGITLGNQRCLRQVKDHIALSFRIKPIDRKGRTLTGDDLKHYQRIVIALVKTAEATEKLEAIAAQASQMR